MKLSALVVGFIWLTMSEWGLLLCAWAVVCFGFVAYKIATDKEES